MKIIKSLLIGASALALLISCSKENEEPEVVVDPVYDDAYFASNASFTSSSSLFTLTDGGATVSFPVSGGEVVIDVNCGTAWTAVGGDLDWLDLGYDSTSLTLTAPENEETSALSGTVTLQTASQGIAFGVITVIQGAAGEPAVISLSTESVNLSDKAPAATVDVEANYDWDFSYDSGCGWLSVERDGSGVVLTLTGEISGDDILEETVDFTCGDGSANTASAQLKVSAYGSGLGSLILTYKTTSSNTTVTLPFDPDYAVDCVVDWGDGSDAESVTAGLPTHVYASAGEYDVTINGTVQGLKTYNYISQADAAWLTGVKQWGMTGLTSLYGAFYQCSNLASIPADTVGSFSDVTTFKMAFCYCTSLTSLPEGLLTYAAKADSFMSFCYGAENLRTIPAGLFDACTEVTTFQSVFYNCLSFVEIPAGLFDNNRKNTNFNAAFYHCETLTSIPDGLFSDFPEVETFSNAFCGCKNIKEIPAGLFANDSKVTDFHNTFFNCWSVVSIGDGIFSGCSSVENFADLFYGCENLLRIPDGLFDDCPEVTNFEAVFQDCYYLEYIPKGLFDHCPKNTSFAKAFYYASITEIPEGLFDHCPLVTDFSWCFAYCDFALAIPKGLFDNCPLVTDFSYCFYLGQLLESIPEGLFDNCPAATDFTRAFYDCERFTSIPTGLFDNCREITGLEEAFAFCSNLTGESPYTVLSDGTKVHLYERADHTDEFTAPTLTTKCFREDTGLSDYSDIPSGWK